MTYLFALLSLVVLMPLVMFLNVGFSKKGKVFIIFSSFLFAELGLFAQISYPLWQIVLIILLLITVLAYLIVNRMEGLMFLSNDAGKLVHEKEHLIFEEEDLDYPFEEEEIAFKEVKEEPSDDQQEVANTILDLERIEAIVSKEEEIIDEKPSLIDGDISLDNMIEELILNNDYPIIEKQTLTAEQTINDLIVEINELDHFAEDVREDRLAESLEEVDSNNLFTSLESDLEVISPIVLSENAIIEADIKITDFSEDEIEPIKEFKTQEKELETSINKEQIVKKETYLAEIEKLLEED